MLAVRSLICAFSCENPLILADSRLWTALVLDLVTESCRLQSSAGALDLQTVSKVHVYCALGDYVSPLELLVQFSIFRAGTIIVLL